VLESARAKAENHAGYPYAGVRNLQTLNDAPIPREVLMWPARVRTRAEQILPR
jgi:hypothetical protein